MVTRRIAPLFALTLFAGCPSGGDGSGTTLDTNSAWTSSTATGTGTGEASTGGSSPTTSTSSTDASTASSDTSTTGGATDGATAGSGSSGTDTGVVEPSCPLPPPSGADSMGLLVEPCEIVGEPLRAKNFIGSLQGLALDTQGAVLINLTDHPTQRLVDAASPGCQLTRTDADDLPPPDDFFGEWGPIEVTPDGTIYEMGTWDGLQDFVWSGAKQGGCVDVDGWSTSHRVGFSAKGLAISGVDFNDFPVLFDLETCTSSNVMAIPVDARGAMFYDDDLIIVTSNRLQRWTAGGAMMLWESPDTHNVGAEVVRCGDDLCLQQGGSSSLARFSAVDGKLVAKYPSLSLFGIDATVTGLGTSPDHQSILVGFAVDHPSPECSAGNMKNIHVYRVSGF